MTKTCRLCNLEKSADQFNKETRMKDGLTTACRECIRIQKRNLYANNEVYRNAKLETIRKVRQRNIDAVAELLKTSSCVDCGEDDPVVLEFDHIDRTNKRSDISSMVYNHASLTSIMEEIEKCEIRCANCHRRRTHKQLGWLSRQ